MKLSILPGTGRKKIFLTKMWLSQSLKPVVIFCKSASASDISRVSDMSCFIVQKAYGAHCIFSATKLSLYTYCRIEIQRLLKFMLFNSLLRWWLTSIDHGTFCNKTKASIHKLTPITVEFGQEKTLTLCRNKPCTRKKWQYGVVLHPFLSLDSVVFF